MMVRKDRETGPSGPLQGVNGTVGARLVIERPLGTMLGVFHAGLVIQLVLCCVSLSRRDDVSWDVWMLTALAIVSAGSICWWVLSKGTYRVPVPLGAADLLVAVSSLVVLGIRLPRDAQIGDWNVWAPANADLTVATLPAWIVSIPVAFIVGAAVAGLYVAVVLPGNTALVLSVVMNAVSYLVFVVAAVIILDVARRMAEQVERSHADAVRLAGQLRLDRYLFHMHNASGLLARLSRDDTPPVLLAPLRVQAAREASRLREAMTMEASTGPGTRSLGEVVDEAAAGFGQLPIEVNDLLGRHVMLPLHQAMAVQMALITVLYNVEFHAYATEVTIHAEDHGSWWEVSVVDDGVGFDISTVPPGFGLRHQVVEPLAAEGLTVDIESRPGEGTSVTIESRPGGRKRGRVKG
ncbi:hypothetical protein [uncultured Bifidobacterium sp.]|uniref:sensor histidine kinase n=1 Tax=uncultured Bifidobacterium sp. TaxID=165187 RepID=UPI0028DCB60A|nr:hypothetical protein [uncultured Bifidobacterium sp.]